MLLNLIYILLAILGLSFLIFIHELGHYWMARRQGMRVEVFSIGFGKALYFWMHDGVRWQIGWLPFGGYVKIAGQEAPQEGQERVEVADSFYAKSPLARMKVSFMGPFVNLLFALLVFGALWLVGGREKNYAEYTHKIGWVDPQSELYASGIRPGDEISEYAGRPFQNGGDNLYAPMVSGDALLVRGNKVDYNSDGKTNFEYTIKPYLYPASAERKTSGILASANYMIYDRLPGNVENPLPEGAPLQGAGMEYGDRLVWVDGVRIFSSIQLDKLLNDHRALLTIQRGGKKILRRVPRIEVQELKMDPNFKDELTDWQFEAKLNATKIQKLRTIPYNLSNKAVVENRLKFIEKEFEKHAFPEILYSESEEPLQEGDKIVAVDGQPISQAYELLAALQSHHVLLIVERPKQKLEKIEWRQADEAFDKEFSSKDLENIVSQVGTPQSMQSSGNLVLLKPVLPKMRMQFHLSPESQAWFAAEMLEKKKEMERIEDPEKRAQALHYLASKEKELLLGFPQPQDRKIIYNPGPIEMFSTVFEQIGRTLIALFTGALNPKWISGPVGIVQVVHDNWMHGFREALYWLGAISLNLGMLNLLPIPVLDGGSILISVAEIVTGRKLSPKTLEKIVLPFAVLLIGFFVFLTYHDLSRIFGGFWS